MSFSGGGSASHKSSTSKTNSSTTTTPIVPDWASNLTQTIAGKVGGLTSLDPQNLVAPAQALQTRAAAGATNLSGSPWNFDTAADLTRGAADTSWLGAYAAAPAPVASAGRAADYVGDYLNPFLRDVVGATAADLDAHDGQVRAQQALDLAGSGAFGGSGAALTQSMTQGELSRARAAALGNLRSLAYTTALGAATGDADRATQAQLANAQTLLQDRGQKIDAGFRGQQQQLAAGNQLAGLSSAYDANQRANIQTQAELGGTFRGIDQEQRQAPVSQTQQLVAMLSGLPISLFAGQQTDGTSNTVNKETSVEVHARTKP